MPDIFEENNETVPLKATINGKEVTIGQAKISDVQDGIVHVEADISADSSEDVKKLFGGTIENYSFSADDKLETDLLSHEHLPVQHRDGKPPWCRECGLTKDYKKPVSNIPVSPYGFGKPANPIHRSNN